MLLRDGAMVSGYLHDPQTARITLQDVGRIGTWRRLAAAGDAVAATEGGAMDGRP